jgi:hypothetical protein
MENRTMTEAVATPTTTANPPPCSKDALHLSLMQNAITIMLEAVCLLGVAADQIAPELDRVQLCHLASALRGADRCLMDAADNLADAGRGLQLEV